MNRRRRTAAAVCLAAGLCAAAAAGAAADTAENLQETENVSVREMRAEDLYDGTYNLLLIGSDRRNDGWNGNSDTMILVTLNDNTSTMFMVSFMRDTAADIPGIGTRKLNAAFANGGALLLSETLAGNFEVKIDNYASVDFVGVADIIDAIGGVDIVQTPEEVAVTNGYIYSLCEDWEMDPELYYITEDTTHLNGLQALAYMRDRFIGNDYARTERQRTVLTAVLNSLDASDPVSALKLLKAILQDVDTDLTLTSMMKLASYLPKLEDYDLVTDRIPYDDLHGNSGEMLVPSQPSTNDRLLSTIYAKE